MILDIAYRVYFIISVYTGVLISP